jgi:Protein of unknown function (DUF2891)
VGARLVGASLLAAATLTVVASLLATAAEAASISTRSATRLPAAATPVLAAPLDAAAAGRFAALALDCVHREYPNKISHTMQGDADVLPPRAITPAFYGCYDWHSAVHAHWLLARLSRTFPAAPFVPAAKQALASSLTVANLKAELDHLQAPGRASFERPYGLAWLLALSAELHAWQDPDAQRWAEAMVPLETATATRLNTWLLKLARPNRSGEHAQTAFALGLVYDWAAARNSATLLTTVRARAAIYYGRDRNCPLAYEPAGEDFVSPCIAEADLMRRVLPAETFALWLKGFLPQVPTQSRGNLTAWLRPEPVVDRTDGKMAHIDGLNLSRAWMLRGIANALPPRDSRRKPLLATASAHRDAALPAVTGEHYEGGHWLGTFAVMLETQP